MKILGLVSVMALLFGAIPGHAQERCPPPLSLEMLKERLRAPDVGEVDSQAAVSGLVQRALSGDTERCPLLVDQIEPQTVVEELIHFASTNRSLSAGVSSALFTGLRGALRSSTTTLALPIRALAVAVEEGASPRVQGEALRTIQAFAGSPLAASQLLTWARAERGPPSLPDLPERVVTGAYFAVRMEDSERFRATLEAAPELILNARVRCWVETPQLWQREGPPPPPGGQRPCAAFDPG